MESSRKDDCGAAALLENLKEGFELAEESQKRIRVGI